MRPNLNKHIFYVFVLSILICVVVLDQVNDVFAVGKDLFCYMEYGRHETAVAPCVNFCSFPTWLSVRGL